MIALSLSNVANVYCKKEEYDKSLDLHKQTLEIRKVIYKDKPHPSTADSICNIARIYNHKGEFDIAIELHQQALEMRRVIYIEDRHPDIADSLSNVGSIYKNKREYDKALKLHHQALVIKKVIYKEELHLSTADSLYNIANIYSAKGEYEEASKLYQQVIKVRVNYKIYGRLVDALYHLNQLEEALTTVKLMIALAEQDSSATLQEKLSINHNIGCMYHIAATRAKEIDNEQEASEFLSKADESFKKALEYDEDLKNSVELYADYAMFLIRSERFLEAYVHLQNIISSGITASGLGYGVIEKQTVAKVLQRAIEESHDGKIEASALYYAYYLIISNYEKFIEVGIEGILPKVSYLEAFEQDVEKAEDLNYVSYLMLEDACNILDQPERAAEYQRVAEMLKQAIMQQQSGESEQRLDDETMQGAELETDQGTESVQATTTVLCAKIVYSNKLLNSQLGCQLLEHAYKIGGLNLHDLVLDLGSEPQAAEEMLISAKEQDAEMMLYRLLGKEVKKHLITIKAESGETKALVSYIDQVSGEVLSSEISEDDKPVLKLDINQAIKQSFYNFASMLYGATIEQAESISQKAKELIQLVVDSVRPALQTDEEVGLLTFLYDILGTLESGSSFSFPAPPRKDSNPDDFGDGSDGGDYAGSLGPSNSFDGLFGQINSTSSDQLRGDQEI